MQLPKVIQFDYSNIPSKSSPSVSGTNYTNTKENKMKPAEVAALHGDVEPA